jgi:beta-barrel assembly-enhancing protease
MKRSAAFLVVLLVALAALYASQRHERPTEVSANAVVGMVADAQRDLTRAPMRLTRLSDDEEIAIGNELAQRYDVTMQLSAQEHAYEHYIQRVGLALGQHAHRRLPYSFHLLPDRNLMNAFSLPGGHVYIGEGLLDLMTSEDQLAFVLGHELEHIDHYHCAERVQVEARLKNLQLEVVGALVQIPLEVWEAGYTKDEELEADREGMHLSVVAGYSPYGAVALFEKCAKLHDEYVIHAHSPEQELSELAMQSLEGYFRSHPLPSERLAQANVIISQNHWQDRTAQKPFRLEYEVHNGEYVK